MLLAWFSKFFVAGLRPLQISVYISSSKLIVATLVGSTVKFDKTRLHVRHTRASRMGETFSNCPVNRSCVFYYQ